MSKSSLAAVHWTCMSNMICTEEAVCVPKVSTASTSFIALHLVSWHKLLVSTHVLVGVELVGVTGFWKGKLRCPLNPKPHIVLQ